MVSLDSKKLLMMKPFTPIHFMMKLRHVRILRNSFRRRSMSLKMRLLRRPRRRQLRQLSKRQPILTSFKRRVSLKELLPRRRNSLEVSSFK